MNSSKVTGTHPLTKASLIARESFRVYCGDIASRPAASHITLQLRVRILPHALISPSGFSLTGEAKKYVRLSIPPSSFRK